MAVLLLASSRLTLRGTRVRQQRRTTVRSRGGAYGTRGVAGHGRPAGRAGAGSGEGGEALGRVGPVHDAGGRPEGWVEDVVPVGLRGHGQVRQRLGRHMGGHPQGEEQREDP
ncbi:hypothetical protein ACIGXF_25215 [Streptomyces sp. NPDC053086]|uniref:hypothetical protein n=1 Tax=unclassified Streptomyces TaxID=2593676 RepID=UPI0037D1B5CF